MKQLIAMIVTVSLLLLLFCGCTEKSEQSETYSIPTIPSAVHSAEEKTENNSSELETTGYSVPTTESGAIETGASIVSEERDTTEFVETTVEYVGLEDEVVEDYTVAVGDNVGFGGN